IEWALLLCDFPSVIWHICLVKFSNLHVDCNWLIWHFEIPVPVCVLLRVFPSLPMTFPVTIFVLDCDVEHTPMSQ
ncbi:MAG: hypothetical protein AAF438_10610, partial [Pseudomonadota bacterium]